MDGVWKLFDMTDTPIGEASTQERAIALAKSVCEFENPIVTVGVNGWLVVGVFQPGFMFTGGSNMLIKIKPPSEDVTTVAELADNGTYTPKK